MTAIACTAVALSACGNPSATGDPAGDSTPQTATNTDQTELRAALAGRTFLSSEIDGRTLVVGTQIQLSFQDDAISASAGCNQLGGSTALDGDTLVVGALMQTEMGCEVPLIEQDIWLGTLLQAGPTLLLNGDTLTITSTDATVTLVDRRVADPDVSLTDTTWIVDGLIGGDSISSIPQSTHASMTITEGRAAVQTGCNSGAATVEITADALRFAPLETTEIGCEPNAQRLEQALRSVLSGDVSYTIEARRLTLLGVDSAGSVVGLTMTAS